MSSPDVNAFQNWFAALPVPWMVAGPNGQAEAKTWPAYLDSIATQAIQARYQAFPDKAASDALPHLGADRQLIQGLSESQSSFRTRLRTARDQWSRAGTPCSVLEQLWYYGLTGAYWVQQNGMSYTFGSNTLTPGSDPTALLTAANTSALASTLTSTVAPYRTIPAATPWFAFDGNTDLTNRFTIVIPTWPFSALSVANFNGTDSATVVWPFAFGSSTYSVIYGMPSDNVVLSNDGTAQTTTQTVIRASGPWTGSVWVIGFAAGVNPLNTFSAASVGALKSIISAFRPNALCMGVFAIQSGRMWDWPANTTWDGYGGNWDSGPSSVSQILGAF